MKRVILVFILAILGAVLFVDVINKKGEKPMRLTSPTFQNNTKIPAKYTCDRENVNPPLSVSDVPINAKSLVLIVDDPDAPSKTWVHWTVFNIDPSIKEVGENNVPKGGVEGITDFGKPGYKGPCPPAGTHRYFFKLYALDIVFSLSKDADKKLIEEKMQSHTLSQTELIGLYSRK